MPITPTYPGVYIEEVPSSVRTIVGVATSITAFVGRARRGPTDVPVRVQNFGDYERAFGGLWLESTMGYAVQQFFAGGGSDALIVRLTKDADSAVLPLDAGGGADLVLRAASAGEWGLNLRVSVDHDVRPGEAATTFNLSVVEVDPADSTGKTLLGREDFRNISVEPAHPRFVTTILDQQSTLVRIDSVGAESPDDVGTVDDITTWVTPNTGSGTDGVALTSAEYEGSPAGKTGIHMLERADLFNLLCLPPPTRDTDHGSTTWEAAAALCAAERAVLLVDAPATWDDTASALAGALDAPALLARTNSAAVYFPRLRIPDPLAENRLADFAPCGAVAGVIARTDAQRGVWKAPAGQDTVVVGARGPTVPLTDGQNGQLNPLAVNCIRSFPVSGTVVWGARTWEGADQLASQWKYLPVRRLALFIEETLYRALQWVVFEPNDDPLRDQIRLNVGAFMQDLFRQGAFQGRSPKEAYLVKCDRETTTQTDVDRGVVNVVVGFAPLKPAEFVIVRIQQLAGQTAT